MTVAELIRLLQKTDPDSIVHFKVEAYDGEVYPVNDVMRDNLNKNVILFP